MGVRIDQTTTNIQQMGADIKQMGVRVDQTTINVNKISADI